MIRVSAPLLAAGIALATAGCGPSHTAVPKPNATLGPLRVRIVEHAGGDPDAFYRPDPIRAHVGEIITWTNLDSDPHDVTARNGLFASGPIANGSSYTWVPRQPGTYKYFCTLHPEMHGIIIVRP